MDEPAPESSVPEQPSPPPDTCPCPQCGHAVDPALIAGAIVQCPQCGTQFFPPVPGEFDELEPGTAIQEPEKKETEEELSELRIRQAVTMRRSLYRTRSYLIVAMSGCLFLTLQLTISAVKDWRGARFSRIDAAYLLFAIGALIGAIKVAKRVMDLQAKINAELRARELEELEAAKHEPDWTPLSDGSQQAKNLERMLEKQDGDQIL